MLTLGAVFAASLTLASYTANTQPETADDPVQALLDCRAVQSAEARLACLDAALGAFAQALDSGRIEVTDHGAGPSPSALARFSGLFTREDRPEDAPSLAREETLDDGSVAVIDDSGEIEEMRGLPVARVSVDRYDVLTIHLENGEVWRQADTDFVSPPREDQLATLTAEIERGLFGARFMTLSHNDRRFRARRID